MKKEIKIVGKNYPKIGDTFYWKDFDGEIHEDVCQHIEEEDNPDIDTMYYTHYNNGSGSFIVEEDILNPLDMEVEVFKKKMLKETIKRIAGNFNDDVFRNAILPTLKRFMDEDKAYLMLDVLSDPDEYEI